MLNRIHSQQANDSYDCYENQDITNYFFKVFSV